jgi:hypothetical protein
MPTPDYKLRINGGSLVNQVVDVGYVFSHPFTGLDGGTEYAIEIAEVLDSVQSAWSSAVRATTFMPAMVTMRMVVDDAGNALVDNGGSAVVTIE